MMKNVYLISDYQPVINDKFLFDANIWMYLYCPVGGYKKGIIRKYDIFLKKILQAKSSIFISSLVLSEFFNSYIRLEYNILHNEKPEKYKDFKRDFRNTYAYKKLVIEIKTIVKNQILKLAKRTDDEFSRIDIDKIFENIEQSDFNDNYYLTLAETKNFKIVTDDGDFVGKRKVTIPILTANYRLLKGKQTYA